MRARAILVTCGFLIAAVVFVDARQNKAESGAGNRLVVRMRPSGSPVKDAAAVDLFAKLFAAERLPVDEGTTLDDLSMLRCGRVDGRWLTKLREANGGIEGARITEARTVVVPPCPFWTASGSTTVPEGSTVSHALMIQLGAQGPVTRTAVARANDWSLESLEHVEANAKLELPYAAHFKSYTLNSTYAGASATAALTELRALEAHASSAPEGEVALISGIDADCVAREENQLWPFHVSDLVGALNYNATQRPRPPRKAVVAVVDTGVDVDEMRLPFSYGREPRKLDNRDNDENGYVDDVWGANMDGSEGLPVRNTEYRYGEHGTHVAGLVTGGLSSTDLEALVRERIEVRVLNVVSREVTAVPVPTTRFVIRTGSIAEALRYAAEEPAIPIVNISIESDYLDPGILLAIKNSGALVIAAAGNAGRNLDNKESYPAALPDRGRLISVAAHDLGGQLLSTSNWGGNTVDLAAPGCKVESILPGQRRGRMSGTSQAAPLVSFTAALLYSEGLSIPQVKQRLLLTTHRDSSQLGVCTVAGGGCVATQGRLDIATALRLYEDAIVMANGVVRYGSIESACITIDDTCEPLTTRLKKLVPHFGANSARAWLQSQQHQLHTQDVQVGPGKIRFRETGQQMSTELAIDEITSIVAAVFR